MTASGQRIEDHFGDVTEMVGIGSRAQRAIRTVSIPLSLFTLHHSKFPQTRARLGYREDSQIGEATTLHLLVA